MHAQDPVHGTLLLLSIVLDILAAQAWHKKSLGPVHQSHPTSTRSVHREGADSTAAILAQALGRCWGTTSLGIGEQLSNAVSAARLVRRDAL